MFTNFGDLTIKRTGIIINYYQSVYLWTKNIITLIIFCLWKNTTECKTKWAYGCSRKYVNEIGPQVDRRAGRIGFVPKNEDGHPGRHTSSSQTVHVPQIKYKMQRNAQYFDLP